MEANMARQVGAAQSSVSGSPADVAGATASAAGATPPTTPPAPQMAAEEPATNPLEGLPPKTAQFIMMMARRVQEIMMVLQQFIPAVVERISELEAAVGGVSPEGQEATPTAETLPPTEGEESEPEV
jgi:hypothetical protein